MAIYQYTAPDGNKYRVNAPEGATDQQVYGLVLQNYPFAGQSTKELEEAKSAPSTLGDVGRTAKQSLAGGLQSLTNLFGADNAASQYLGEAQQSAFEGMSPARKEEMARRQELQERAQKGSALDQAKAGVGGFFDAPLQTGLGALVSSAPIIAAGLLPGGQLAAGASLGARALAGARGVGGVGGLMGLGGQKGQDYAAVKQELLNQGVDPATAEEKAQEAAAYSLQNAPRQGAALGAGILEGVFGVERILANAAKKVSTSQGASSLTPPEFKQKLGAVAGSAFGEALPEAIQATVGQVGTNIALNQAGVSKDLTDGLAGTVAHDALVGSVLGLAVSPLQVSNLQRQYKQALVDDQAKKQAEADAKVQAETQKAEAERAVLQKQTDEIQKQMEQQQAIALPAPSEEIPVEEVQIDPLKNPLGNIRKSEVPFDIYKQIDDYRKQAGLPRLKEYSIEDFVDAMPGQNPKAEQGLLDQLITAKSGYAGEKYTAQDILNQAKLKNVETNTKGFQDFLARTTGVNALEKMSQPQLHAAFKALNNLPASEGLNILPEGTNARRFDEKQYDKAIKGVDFLLAELGVPVDPSEVIKTIKEYTNLTEDSHAGAILDTAIKNGDVDLIKTPRYEIYDPKTGTVMPSTYTSRTAARAAAAKRGLNVRQITTDAIAAPTTSATLPEGFDIREGAFKEGEAPTGYDVLAGEETLFKANTVEEANAKKASFERTRAGMANARENQITQLNNAIEASQKRLTTMEAQGKGQTTGYQKAAGKHAKLVADTQAKIAALTEEVKKFDPKVTPLAVKPMGNKAIGRKGYTVFEQGQARATYPSRQAAEEGILADMDEKQLQELTQQQGRRAVGKKAQAELERRTAPKPTEGKPVSKVLEDIEVEKVKAAEAKETPGLKEKMAAVEAQLKPMLAKFGLGGVKLNFVEKMDAEGSYNESLIKIALGEKEPVRVLRHESLHALKDLNFFTPQQWSALERMAKDQWIDKYLKKKATDYKGKPMSRYDAYVDLYKGDMSKVTEEAIADAFADFANNKAPAGMLAALLKRLNDFFTALRNALNSAGFQTYEDVFGKIERGELKAGQAQGGTERLSVKEYQKEQKQAEAYADANGIMPYVSEPIDELPADSPRYSLQSYNPDKHLSFDPTLGVPINKDGTVTVYYHTTKENALRIAQNRMIPSDGRALIFLTNESGGDSILKNRGNFDQDLDGSTVLVYVTPDQLQVDEEYDNGRRDFFIPLAEGDYFANKMKLQSIQKSRKAPITDDFSYGDHEERITRAVNDYKAATPAERRKLVSTARKLLKKEHNVGSLLTENGKLEKTRIGDYNISYDGYSVASQGLGLASAQNITDKVNTCPRSAICEGLCLGETSGGNFMFGGAAKEDVDNIEKSAFRAGARMMQYLKTEALIVNPEAFATLLQGEIDSLAKWCASPTQIKVDPETKKRLNVEKEFYAPAIRLNVTSDFKPTMFRGLIESNPEVMFYDYTKLGSESIADNHHLTYSSTGFGQMVDGKKVFFKDKSGKYDHNWATMRSRLNAGQNVAMAFSSKSGLPKFLADAETGVEFQVLDGDDYDARFLDEKSAVKEASGGKGVIVGLRNKAGNMTERNATEKTEGFFVKYDPKTDGDTVVVPNQLPFKLAKAEPKPAAPSTERASLRTLTPDSTTEEIISILPETPMFRGVRGSNTSNPVGAQYFSSSEVFAKTYSPSGKVDKHRVTLQNPLVVSDADWSQYANSPFNPIEDIEAKVREGGHDGVVNVRKTPMGSMVTVLALDSKTATAPNERLSLRPFDSKELPQGKKEYTLPADTLLYHGAHETRAQEIEKTGKILISRSPIKTNSGTLDEGGLVFFGGEDTARRYANAEADPMAVQAARNRGESRNPGVVFETAADRPYKLMNKNYRLSQKEADALNKALGIPDYKRLKKDDSADIAAYRAVTNSNTVERYKTNKGEMVVAWPKIFDTLGYDGFFDDFAIALPADNGIRLVGESGKMERFSLREAPETEEFKQFFADSKVVDKNGKPLVVSHISKAKPTVFDKKYKTDLSSMGFHFGTKEQAQFRATQYDFDSRSPTMGDYYLSIQNPLEVSHMASYAPDHLAEQMMDMDLITEEKYASFRDKYRDEPDIGAALVKILQKAGYDGLVYSNEMEGEGNSYVPFEPTQIKSATNNTGAYSKYNPDVRYSLRDSTDPDTLIRVNETTTTREEKGYVERITQALGGDTYSQLRAQSLNRYNRLSDVDKAVVKKRGGAALMADESAEAGALQSDLAAGVTASVLGVHDRNGGIPIYVNGVTKAFNDGGKIKGPVAIFAPLSKYNDPLIYQLYQFWAAAQRGSRLNEQGKPDIFTDDDLKRAEKLEQDHPEFRQIQEEWTVFNNGLMQYLVDTGVLSEGDRARFTEFSDYIPFYRQMEGEKTIGPNIFQSISGVKKPKKLSEGKDKAPLADFLETIVRNTQSSIQMGMKNVAAQRAIDRAMEIDMAERLRPNAPTGLDTVQVLEKGQVVTYQVADHLFIDAVKSLNMPELPFIGLLSGPANFLRNMVTKDPGFMLANMVRDSMAAYVTSGVKMTPLVDTMSNFGKAMAGTSPEFEALLNAGIGGGYEFSQNIEMSGRAFEKELNKKYEGKTLFQRILNPMTAPTSLWEALEKGTTASDMATRIEVYKRTLAETNNEAEALHRALEVMNFNRKGSSPVIRILTAAIPFLNARMQGLDVLYRASFGQMNNKDAAMIQKRFIVRGLTMAALSAMYWTLTHDDEEYKKQEQETKDNNWLVPSLGIKIPIPFEIGVIFKVIPERIMALTLGQDTNKDFMDSMIRNLRSTLAIDYLPQAIKPFVETETNFSLFTRRPIVGQGLEGVAPEFQIGPGTSSLAAFAGSNLGMSPMKIDHLIGGYTGTMGMYMVSALDGIMNMNAENPNASKRFEQLPFIKRFALDPEARGTVTGYYDLKNATDEVVRTSSLLERTMNFEERGRFMQENIKMLANKDYILDLEKTMKNFRQMQVMIRSSNMDADAKREALLRINQAQNALTANINTIRANVM